MNENYLKLDDLIPQTNPLAGERDGSRGIIFHDRNIIS